MNNVNGQTAAQKNDYDLLVVGGGSGGYAAARTARALGANVAIVDQGPLGGLCILRGCMPSKTLIATSDLMHEIREAGGLGVRAAEPRVDFRATIERKREVIRGFADYRIEGLQTFELIEGPARFLSDRELAVGDRVLRAPNFIIATGSVVAPPAFPGLSEVGYIDSDAALDLDAPPKSLIVLGGGYVAIELGQFFARIGVPTTIVIRSPRLLTAADNDIGEALTGYLRDEGIRIVTEAKIERAERAGDRKRIVYRKDGAEASVEAQEIFYALGRVPNIEGLDLEKAGVRSHPVAGIEVDATMRTSNRCIFAIGDVIGKYPLVHVAIQEGEIAARNAMTNGHIEIDYTLSKAHTIFSDPQVAIAGETEKELQASGVAYLKAVFPFDDHGKAISIGKTKGFVKMLAAPDDGRILGAAVLGAQASDLIHEVLVAMYFRATVFDFVRVPHLHPTMAEILTNPAEELVVQIEGARMAAARGDLQVTAVVPS
ncbi:MAG: dihydrolipoyl dehydrogenase [Candidatus Eremiobacteraeota bacterium]|nr:dihydrolipoyl dehydrogenase [Candidatus Eremiobacteraeota bacterium]